MLHHIFQAQGPRKIILSSFSPEICILLSVKQNTYPVMFITNAGIRSSSDMDVRARSLQNAVHFAKRWNLAGIVFATQTLVACPRLVGYVKRSGLACGSYGSINNVPANAKVCSIPYPIFIFSLYASDKPLTDHSIPADTKGCRSPISHGR